MRIRSDLASPCSSSPPRAISRSWATLHARQPDSKYFRDWEIAGTSHYDTYSLSFGPKDDGSIDADAAFFDTMINTVNSPYPGIVDCVQADQCQRSDVRRTRRRGGDEPVGHVAVTAPPACRRLQLDADARKLRAGCGTATCVVGSARRTSTRPSPRSRVSGQTGSSFCFLFGTTAPFDAAKLATLYPSHAAFVKAWNAATDKAVKAGFILAADAKNIKAAAAPVHRRRLLTITGCVS